MTVRKNSFQIRQIHDMISPFMEHMVMTAHGDRIILERVYRKGTLENFALSTLKYTMR